MLFTLPVVSALTAGVLIILQMALMMAVVLARRNNRQSLGDGGSSELLRAIRRHGNLAENAGVFIAGFTLLELLGVGRPRLEILCGIFVLGRISHAIGLTLHRTVNPLRIGGVAATVGVGIALAVWLIRMALPQVLSPVVAG
jgi:uncharacterized membrane protein YecN with MAPEG domain